MASGVGRLYRGIADSIAVAIEAGRYPRGQRLPSERELCHTYGVSRPVVRQALIALEEAGKVVVRPGSGAYVADAQSVTGEVMDVSIYDVAVADRIVFGEIAALAAAGQNHVSLSAINAALKIACEDPEQAVALMKMALAAATENPLLIDAAKRFSAARRRSPLASYLFGLSVGTDSAEIAGELGRVVEAVRTRDREAARRAMLEHLARMDERLVKAIEVDAAARRRLKMSSHAEERGRANPIDPSPGEGSGFLPRSFVGRATRD